MNSLAKFAASQSHQASKKWLTLNSFSTSAASKRLPKSQKPSSDSKSPSPPPPSKEWPKPSKIPYQSKVSNSLTLSGYIHMPVQFEAAPDGKFWAGTVISQNPSSDSPPLWIPIIFEGDLAHVAACHLKENDHVYIDGQLSADPPSSNAAHNQANVQVMVRAINFVDESPPKTKTIASPKEERTLTQSASIEKGTETATNTWRDLLDNPKEWLDYREQKLNGLVKPKFPDFKRKDGVHALWLDSAPMSVVPELEALEFDIPKVNQHKGEGGSWKDLVENPKMWWDNRLDKINGKVKEKYPDFKHKETGKALWVSDLPTWAESKLPSLASKKWSE